MAAAAAATGILSLYGGSALADTSATGVAEGSPGVLSGNTVQVPVEAPVNVCGNAVGVITALSGAFDNSCVNALGKKEVRTPEPFPSEPEECTEECEAAPPAAPTPPVPRTSEPPRPTAPPTRTVQTPPPAAGEQPGVPPQLAETGGKALLAASAASAALITGGLMMYRRGRAASLR